MNKNNIKSAEYNAQLQQYVFKKQLEAAGQG